MLQPTAIDRSGGRLVVLCPSLFLDTRDGIGRVSAAFARALAAVGGENPFVLSANEPSGCVEPDRGRAFGRNYGRLMLFAAGERGRQCQKLGFRRVCVLAE